MRAPTYLTLLTASLALAACEGGGSTMDSSDMPMAENMPATDDMPMSGDMPMTETAGRTASGEGTVTEIDDDSGTITIDHAPIPEANWPAMTMAFEADEAMRAKVKTGDSVSFELLLKDGAGQITAIDEKR